MEHESSKWLKDDLGFPHMCDEDVYGLTFHPRRGNLCRRFLKFLIDSSVSKSKHPNALIQCEYEQSIESLKHKNSRVLELDDELEAIVAENEDINTDLTYLTNRLEHLRALRQKKEGSLEVFEAITNRVLLNTVQLNSLVEESDYLTDTPLMDMYSRKKQTRAEDCVISQRQLASIEEDIAEYTRDANLVAMGVTKLFDSLDDRLDGLDYSVRVRNASLESLLGLKIPIFEEEISDVDPEGREAKDLNTKLCSEVNELNQQVKELAEKYDEKMKEISSTCEQELKECKEYLAIVDGLKAEADALLSY